MQENNTTPWMNLSQEDIARLVQFYDPKINEKLDKLQRVGCFHLWNALCDETLGYAYLADEVGMGKTYQALGVIALLYYIKPSAKVIILTPGKEMQKQWSSDWHSFFQTKFCPDGIDAHLKAYRIDANGQKSFESRVQPQICENLNQFAQYLVSSQASTYLLRYPSFSLPIRVFDWEAFREDKDALVPFDDLVIEFKKIMDSIGCYIEESELDNYRNKFSSELNLENASDFFLVIYKKKLAALVQNFSPDLIVWDEAQYLRTDATRNNSMRDILGSDLHRQGCRHLFLSATPAHRDIGDIEKLNDLLFVNGDASNQVKPIRIARNELNNAEFRQSVSPWMVRRERTFNEKGKQQYRDFKQIPIDMFAEEKGAMYALTFAAIQKKLVELLDGQNNRFRMGEISCNESVRASIESSGGKAINQAKADLETTLEESSKTNNREPIDEKYLEYLGNRFKELQGGNNGAVTLGLPHAKIDHVVNGLARDCLESGSCTKELVFVRRIATVDELADRLLYEFQRVLDARIATMTGRDAQYYWGLTADEQDESEEGGEVENHDDESIGKAKNLEYFKALSAVRGQLGRLTKYRNSLGNMAKSTLRFLLVKSAEMEVDDLELWHALRRALGVTEAEYETFKRDSNKELLLRRCIAHSFRFTDILVDLDILRRKNRIGYVKSWIDILENPPDGLGDYFANTKVKLRNWIIHFDTIVNKCFKGDGTNNSYAEIAERVAGYFAGLSPVARRSGRRKDANVVPQFKFPIFPNVLICTDVLREGVNLHLFCDRVSHYGIAWNSGDLEQRIGRVERADSLFERRIRENDSYKLHVGFPYLARTLDERQVIKAIKKKKSIDTLFSILPPKETGEIDDARENQILSAIKPKQFEPILPPTPEFPSVGTSWFDTNSSTLKRWSDAMQKMHDVARVFNAGEFEYVACRMIGELEVIAIEWERKRNTKNVSWNISDKLLFNTSERREKWKSTRILYIPKDAELTAKLIQDFWSSNDKKISTDVMAEGVGAVDDTFMRIQHLSSHSVPHPFKKLQHRVQRVQGFRWGGHAVLASIVCRLDELAVEGGNAEMIASEINKGLPFGSATIHDSHLMLVFPIVHGADWKDVVIEKAAKSLARWADRHQWRVLDGKDDDDHVYCAPLSGVCEMNTSEAIEALRSAKQWCEDLNRAINLEIGEGNEWKMSTFDRIVKGGKIAAASNIVLCPGEGKFQIAYALEGLDGPAEGKTIRMFVSGKAANIRVTSNDLDDAWEFMSGEYENWLTRQGYTIAIEKPYFNYAYLDHQDGKQYRRICIVLSAAEMEVYSNRDRWIAYIVKLARYQLLNDVFQFNVALMSVEELIGESSVI